jgi:hypothetical protein
MELLPDSRCRNTTSVVKIAGVNYVPIFCMNCGTHGGLVTEQGVHFVGWMCDSCQEKHPLPPGTYAIPDTDYNRKVAEEWAKAGSIERVIAELQNEQSSLAKLAKDQPRFGR